MDFVFNFFTLSFNYNVVLNEVNSLLNAFYFYFFKMNIIFIIYFITLIIIPIIDFNSNRLIINNFFNLIIIFSEFFQLY